MDAPGGRDKGKELDPAVAGELETGPKRPGDASAAAGYGAGGTQDETRDASLGEAQANPRSDPEESSAASYEERAQPRDEVAEDGG